MNSFHSTGLPSAERAAQPEAADPKHQVVQNRFKKNRLLRTAVRLLASASSLVLGVLLAFATASYNAKPTNSGTPWEFLADPNGAHPVAAKREDAAASRAPVTDQSHNTARLPFQNAAYPRVLSPGKGPAVRLGPIVAGDTAAADVPRLAASIAANREQKGGSGRGSVDKRTPAQNTSSTLRVVIDAMLLDFTVPDSVPPGADIPGSKFGVAGDPPWTVVSALREIGRAAVIAANRMHAISGQWTELEWAQRACESSTKPPGRLLRTTRLRVRPSILTDGRVRLELHPETTRLKPGRRIGSPEVDTIRFTTDVVLREGATAVVSGFIDECPAKVECMIVNVKRPHEQADTPLSERTDPRIRPQPAVRRGTILLITPRVVR